MDTAIGTFFATEPYKSSHNPDWSTVSTKVYPITLSNIRTPTAMTPDLEEEKETKNQIEGTGPKDQYRRQFIPDA